MKVYVAVLTACACLLGGYLFLENEELRTAVARLELDLQEARRVEPVEIPESASRAEVDALTRRLDRIERDAAAPRPVESGADVDSRQLVALEERVAANTEAIAALEQNLGPMTRTQSALDETAERMLAAVGQEGGDGESRGIDRLRELGSLMRKPEEELSDDEWQKRQEITSSFRQVQTQWALNAFDRRLEVKLNEDQKASLAELLAAEQQSTSALRQDGVSREERQAAEAELRTQTDAEVSRVLTPDQNTAWQEYRTRGRRGRR